MNTALPGRPERACAWGGVGWGLQLRDGRGPAHFSEKCRFLAPGRHSLGHSFIQQTFVEIYYASSAVLGLERQRGGGDGEKIQEGGNGEG